MKVLRFILLIKSVVFITYSAQSQRFLTDLEKESFIAESHLECNEYATDELNNIYNEWLSRIELRENVQLSEGELSELKSIFQYAGRNKCNSTYAYKPEIDGLNPLMFHLYFETKQEIKYRIGNTNHLLIIHPKQ